MIESIGKQRTGVFRQTNRGPTLVATGIIICALCSLEPGLAMLREIASGDAECPLEKVLSLVHRPVCRHPQPRPGTGPTTIRAAANPMSARRLGTLRPGLLGGHSYPHDVSAPLLC